MQAVTPPERMNTTMRLSAPVDISRTARVITVAERTESSIHMAPVRLSGRSVRAPAARGAAGVRGWGWDKGRGSLVEMVAATLAVGCGGIKSGDRMNFPAPARSRRLFPDAGPGQGDGMTMPRLLLIAALSLAAAPAAANPWLEPCLKAEGASTTLADRCGRALDWGGLSAREQAAAWTNIGVANAELGRDGDAMGAFDRAAAADPRFAPAFVNRALARARRGMTEAALEDWSRAAALRPDDPEPRLGRASLQLQRGRPEAALEDLNAALALDPENADAHFNRGLALAALNRREAAARAFSRVLALAPGDASAHLRRGLLHAESDPERALADLSEAVRLAPDWAEAWATRGRLQERLGRREAAAEDYRRAFELGHQAQWLNRKIEELGG